MKFYIIFNNMQNKMFLKHLNSPTDPSMFQLQKQLKASIRKCFQKLS